MFYTANMYLNGSGVERDPTKAAEWFRRGAELGDADCMANLGECYNRGVGVEQDFAQAVRWFRQAAELGSDTGMFNLAVTYFWGDGVGEDRAKAYAWMRKAADAGLKEAQVALRELDAANRQARAANGPAGPLHEAAAIERVREQTERAMRKYRQQLVEKLPFVARPWDPHQNWPPPATLPR
jgi:TPR repeat protein